MPPAIESAFPRADYYLRSLERFSATAAVLSSGANVVLRFDSGERTAQQVTPHEHLVSLVEQTAPPGLLAAARGGEGVRYEREFEGRSYVFFVEPRGGGAGGGWRVVIEGGAITDPHARATPVSVPAVPRAVAPALRSATPAQGRAAPEPVSLVAATPAATPAASLRPDLLPIERLLVRMRDAGASDLHLGTGSPPLVRVHGEIRPLDGLPPFDAKTLLAQILEITPEDNRREFEERSDTDFAHEIPGVARFRANLFRDRLGPGAVFRAIAFDIRSAAELGLPRGVLELCNLTKGLVVVTGPTGSGKSTTLAALVDHVNETRRDHIITIEDPIEFVHRSKKCLVNQREVGVHTRSFKDALRAALREDPDVVLVGELRDLETVAIAVETAETGHLVFGTLHTTTAPSTVDRIVDQFPADRQEQIRQMLSESLRGVIAQTLCKKKGGGRVAAYEILLGNSAVSNLIREHKTFQLYSLMQTSRGLGMVTLNDSLLDLVRRNLIEPEEAWLRAVNKAELKTLFGREGIALPAAAAA